MFQPVNHIVEADIRSFFDKVPHDKLLEFIQIRMNDTSMLNLLKKFLKAGYINDSLLVRTEEGRPQGSILSPLLVNIFLHYVLDTWFEDTVKNHVRGYCALVRYADDFVCVVRYKDDARRIMQGLKNRFTKYGLELHPEKSRNISFGNFERKNAKEQSRKAHTFEFLGFTHYCDVSTTGNFKVGRKTSNNKFSSKFREMNTWLKVIRSTFKAKEWWKILALKLLGHFQYYGVSEDYDGIMPILPKDHKESTESG
jgi:RNA-directed DNA polymerase